MTKTLWAVAIAALLLSPLSAHADDFAADRAAVERLMADVEAIAGAQPDLKPILENKETAWGAYSYRDDGYNLASVGFGWHGAMGAGENPATWMAGVILEAEGTNTEDLMAGGYAGVLLPIGLYAEARALAGESRWLAQGGLEWDVATLGPVTFTPFAGGTHAGNNGNSMLAEGKGGVEVSAAFGPLTLSTSAAAVVDDELDVRGELGAGAGIDWNGLSLGIEGTYDTNSGDIGGAVSGRAAF